MAGWNRVKLAEGLYPLVFTLAFRRLEQVWSDPTRITALLDGMR